MWNTLFRSFAGDEQAHGYFPTVARYGAVMTPDDMYQGARLSAAEAIYSGMTTVHDWCHNIENREYAERDIQALKDASIRARFSMVGRKARMIRTSLILATSRRCIATGRTIRMTV